MAIIFKKYFIYLFLERGREREKERETMICERNINRLPLSRPQPRSWPTTQGCAPTGIEPGTLWFTGRHSVTEPHQPGPIISYSWYLRDTF